jgi:hypothetical protein
VTPVNDAPVAVNDGGATIDGKPVVIDVLGNDSDVDGDVLTVIAASSPNGAVTINPNGTLKFEPTPAFVGTAIITYTVSDGHGGFATATVEIVCTESPHVAIDPPSVDLPVTPIAPTAPIHVDGMVLDAVQGISDLHSIGMQIGEHGIILDTVNNIAWLGGMPVTGGDRSEGVVQPLDAHRITEIERILGSDGYLRGSSTWDSEGLTGFSLRFNLLGGSTGSQITIESVVRERTLIVNISDALSDPNRKIVEYRIMQANGAPLPGWLERMDNSVLIGERPANVDRIGLRITIIYSDGSSESRSVLIETTSGEIKPIEQKRTDRVLPFFEQFASVTPFNDDDVEGLGALLMLDRAG